VKFKFEVKLPEYFRLCEGKSSGLICRSFAMSRKFTTRLLCVRDE
jgi:hypothetical protein